jgi:hypothetical protein
VDSKGSETGKDSNEESDCCENSITDPAIDARSDGIDIFGELQLFGIAESAAAAEGTWDVCWVIPKSSFKISGYTSSR